MSDSTISTGIDLTSPAPSPDPSATPAPVLAAAKILTAENLETNYNNKPELDKLILDLSKSENTASTIIILSELSHKINISEKTQNTIELHKLIKDMLKILLNTNIFF